MLDLKKQIQVDPKGIVLNKLPRFYQPAPDFKRNPLNDFLANSKQQKHILDYLSKVNSISLLFAATSEPILYNERSQAK